MSFSKKQFGFSGVEAVIIVVIVALLATLGYVAYNQLVTDKSSGDTDTSQQATAVEDVPAAPEINSASDLDKASNTLDEVNLNDNSDTSDLEQQLSTF